MSAQRSPGRELLGQAFVRIDHRLEDRDHLGLGERRHLAQWLGGAHGRQRFEPDGGPRHVDGMIGHPLR